MATNDRYLKLDATYRNRSSGVNTDRMGRFLMDLDKALVGAYDIITGTGWRRHGAGDGLSTFTTTLDANIWTANSGLGASDGPNWSSAVGVAGSCTNTNAWARYVEYFNGAPTGRQLQWQRHQTNSSGNERFLNMAFSVTGFTGSPSASTPYTTGTYASLWGTVTWGNITSNNWFTNITSAGFMSDTATFAWSIWTSAKPRGDVSQFAFCLYSSSGQDRGFVGLYLGLYDTAGVSDPHPFIVGAGQWPDIAGGDGVYTSGATSGSGSPVRTHSPGASNTWYNAGWAAYRATSGTAFPPGSSTAIMQPDLSGKYRLLPAHVELDNANGTNLCAPKGTAWDMVQVAPMDLTHIFPCVMTDTDANTWLSLGMIALPWPSGVTPTWGGSALSSSAFRRVMQPTVPDTTAPTIGPASPAAGAIAYNQAITIPIADSEAGVASVVISADYSAPDRHELVATGAPLSPTVDGDYTVTPSGTTASVSLVVSRTGGWLGPFTLRVRSTDALGNVSTVYTQAYTISTSPNPAAPDTTAPVIGTFSPAAGAIAYNQAISIPLSDDKSSFKYTVVISQSETSVTDEYAWNGYTMSADYDAGSSFPSSGTAVVLRDGGWPGSFTVRVTAYDAAGNWRSETTAAYTISGANPAAPDAAPPELSLVSPVNSVISKQTPVVLQVSDNRALRAFAVYAAFDSVAPAELVYSATYPWLVTNYRVVVESTGETTRTLTVTRKGEGWRKAPRFFLEATDSSGNKTS